jgi:hypothetical protein
MTVPIPPNEVRDPLLLPSPTPIPSASSPPPDHLIASDGSLIPCALIPRCFYTDLVCRHCDAPIPKGIPIYPCELPDTESKYLWLHVPCAVAHNGGTAVPPPPICKHWKRRGECVYMAQCFFRHPPEVAETLRAKWAEEERVSAHLHTHAPCLIHALYPTLLHLA